MKSTQSTRVYLCLAAHDFPLQALLRYRQDWQGKAIAVLDGEPPGEQVCCVNDQARALGLVPGMARVEIEMFPSVVALSRSPSQETTARTALLECAGCFSPLVEDQSNDICFLCVADITGTDTLFGPPDVLGEQLRKQALALCMRTSIAVCSNLQASVCLALGGHADMRSAVRVVGHGEEASALAPLPLSVLGLSPEHSDTFSMWGISTLGELGKLGETELITRLGQQGKRLRMRARGESPHLFRGIEPGLMLEERMELDAPLELLDSLLFITGVMLDQLIVRVQARILALAAITLQLGLEDGTVFTRTVRPALPSNDRQLWLKLTHLDLQAHPPAAGIRSLLLSGQPGSTSKVQLGLFSPQVPEAMRLDITLARIRNIVGEGCVGRAELKDTHRPDSFRIESFHVPATGSSAAKQTVVPRTALRQLRPAETVHVTLRQGKPDSFFFRDQGYTVEHAYGPWSSGGDWWNPTLWSLEQWDLVARGKNSTVTAPSVAPRVWICCCLTHDLVADRWQVDALYD